VEKFETSLKRLGLDHVDILYMHSVIKKEAALFEPLLNALVKLKKEGKTKFIGVTTHSNEPEVIRAATDSKVYDVVLTAYNFLQPHLAEVKKEVARATQAGLAVIAMKTQAGVYWDRARTQQINMKAALKFVLQDENILTTIPGFTTFDQLELDLTVMNDLTLTEQEKIDLKLIPKQSRRGLYCIQCGECVAQCRYKLDIPTFMRSYMYAYGYRNYAVARDTFMSAATQEIPCRTCSTCSVACKSKFDVRSKMLDIARIKDVPDEFLA
jgi:predicted aldo/keto reductase-like oxidoreductase